MKRTEAESDLDFIGFIVFENKLKPTTSGVLQVLEKANIRKLMCTGDNILTAISVGRECTLIDKSAHCFVPHFVEGKWMSPIVMSELSKLMTAGHSQDSESRLIWESIDNPTYQLDDRTLTVCLPHKHLIFVLIICSRCLRQPKPMHHCRTIYRISKTTPWLLAVTSFVGLLTMPRRMLFKRLQISISAENASLTYWRCLLGVKYLLGCLLMRNTNWWRSYRVSATVLGSVAMERMTAVR